MVSSDEAVNRHTGERIYLHGDGVWRRTNHRHSERIVEQAGEEIVRAFNLPTTDRAAAQALVRGALASHKLQTGELIRDLWAYATGAPGNKATADGAAAGSEALYALYLRVRSALA